MSSPVAGHKMVMKMAVSLTELSYEENSSDNTFHKQNPNRRAWVRQMAGLNIDAARQVLLALAHDPSSTDKEKLEIMEALILDEEIPGADRRVHVAAQQALNIELNKAIIH